MRSPLMSSWKRSPSGMARSPRGSLERRALAGSWFGEVYTAFPACASVVPRALATDPRLVTTPLAFAAAPVLDARPSLRAPQTDTRKAATGESCWRAAGAPRCARRLPLSLRARPEVAAAQVPAHSIRCGQRHAKKTQSGLPARRLERAGVAPVKSIEKRRGVGSFAIMPGKYIRSTSVSIAPTPMIVSRPATTFVVPGSGKAESGDRSHSR